MKQIIGSRFSGLALALVFAGTLAVGAPTASGLFVKKWVKSAKKKAKSTVKKVVSTAKKGVSTVKSTVKKGVSTVKSTVKKGVAAVKKFTKDFEKFALKGAAKLGKVFSKEGLKAIGSAIKSGLAKVGNTIKKGFENVIDKAKALAKKVGLTILIAKAKAAYKKLKNKINSAKSILNAILKEAGGKKKIETLFKKVAKRQFDGEVQSIVKWIASKISGQKIAQAGGRRCAVAPCGFATWPKSFSLTIGVALSLISPKIIGGMIEGRFGVVADLGKDKNKPYDIRGYFHGAAGIGGGTPGVDVAANIMLGLSPDKTENASGGFLGIFAEAGAKIGGEIEIEWSVGPGMKGTPGIGIAVGVQDPSPGAAVMISGGIACTFRSKGIDCL